MILKGLREVEGVETLVDIFDITEFTYTGKDMGERSITATIYHPSPIDFKAGDYAEFQIQSLERAQGGINGSVITEKFYIYTKPTVKKTARPMTHGTAFEYTLTLYPAQYELALVQMRDLGNRTTPDSIIYTGFDSVTFYGGAKELMERIMMVLDEAYGKGTWSYKLSNEVNEEVNDALEKFLFTFSGNTVMDALLKLNDKEGINTTFFINDRTIYVGFKRPYFCRVLDSGSIDTDIDTQMFNMRYGKTSHESIAINYGCLFDITKSVGKETPITKLFAYGAARNLNRFYCSDRIKTGRYVNRLMLPSFDADGKTDFILSEKGIEKFGIREGSKQFEDIYPSLRYVNYGDIRQIQYCIKLKVSGLDGETKDNASFPIARVQCYKVVPSTINVGVNALVECAPPEDIAVYIHTIDSVVKVVLYGGSTDADAIAKQLAHDTIVPTRTKGGTDYIPGSCFAVHDRGFDDVGTAYENADRSAWFTNPNDLETSTLTDTQKAEIQNNQVTYANTPFITDLYRFVSYNQTYFSRDGYSAWGWARLNSNYVSEGGIIAHDSLLVNEVVAVEPVVIPDTDLNIAGLAPRQHTFDIYLRDLGFKLDEQNDFGEMVFVLNGDVKISFIDGTLGGREFNVAGKVTDFQENCICAFNDDATINDEFFLASGYTDHYIAEKAFADGAIWRLRLTRSNLDEPSLSNLAIALPTPELNAKQGDHVVLLDLFMPDIYVHAAENRLLREAQQYLDANDNGSISYAVNFDEVRMQQIHQYALQIREGLKIRVQDEDLGIATENDIKKIFEGELVNNTSLYETTYTEIAIDRVEHKTIEYGEIIEDEDICSLEWIDNEHLDILSCDWTMELRAGFRAGKLLAELNPEFYKDKCTVRIAKKTWSYGGNATFELTDNYLTLDVLEHGINEFGNFFLKVRKDKSTPFPGTLESNISHTPNGGQDTYYHFYCVLEYDVITYNADTEYVPNTHLIPWGGIVNATSNILVEFKAKKHYAVEMELHNTELIVLDNTGYPTFALVNNLGEDALIYKPTCNTTDLLIKEDNSVVFRFEFDTIEGFNDSQDYYPAVLYKSDNSTEYVKTKLLSITESDYEGNGDLPYADFVLDTVTIQVSDNSQRDVGSAPVKTISATLSEQQDASAWATLMNTVEEVAIESEANAAAVENLVNSARKNYLSILSLKDSIFDPDGTCDQTFLQIMMMQIGADSMNYRMLKTSVDLEGVSHNCRLFADSGTSNFEAASDTLYHYVYTQGSQGGTWEISSLSKIALDGVSVYYIALKCQREGASGEWVCDTIQHKVDEAPTHWYFNWGILTVDSAGVYTLIETRGNAYMYGDNLVCGKISDLAKRCYFDLTNGEFALGMNDDGTAALSYIDGVLTIGGLPNEKDIDDILERLGAVEQMEICGENLCIFDKGQFISDVKFDTEGDNISYETLTYNYLDNYGNIVYSYLKAGKYIFSAERMYFYILGSNGVPSSLSRIKLTLQAITSDGNIHREVDIENGLHIQIKIETEVECYFRIKRYYTFNSSERLTINMLGVMLQHGTKATSYQPYLKNIADVLKGSTEIAGGLVMTNVLMLKNINGKVTAGISGITEEDENVLLWGGGTYKEAEYASKNDYAKDTTGDKMPVLLKKDGTGKMGCFEIVNENTISVNSEDGNSKIIISAGKNKQDTSIIVKQGNEVRVLISGDEIQRNSISGKELIGSYVCREKITNNNQDIVVEEVDLSSGSGSWVVNFNAKKIIVWFELAVYSSINYVRANVDVYLCGVKIASSNGLWKSEGLSNMSKSQLFGVVMNAIPFANTSSDKHALEVRLKNVEVYRGSWGNDYRDQLSLYSVQICTGEGTDVSDYTNDSIVITNMASENIIQVGCNGVQVAHKNGGFAQILNDNEELYVKMVGLPTTIPTGDDGKIYNWNGFLRVSGNNNTSVDFTELGYTKLTLPPHVFIPDMPNHSGGGYAQDELNKFGDGDVFIGM